MTKTKDLKPIENYDLTIHMPMKLNRFLAITCTSAMKVNQNQIKNDLTMN